MNLPITSPYANIKDTWLKGALHMHSRNSDGADSPHATLRDYERLGYDFAALTDHNVIPSQQDMALEASMVVLPGCEYALTGYPYSGKGNHPEVGMVGDLAGLEQVLPSVAKKIDLEKQLSAVTSTNAFRIYNHPNWNYDHWPFKQMLRVQASHALEIHNGLCESCMGGGGNSTNKWDMLLSCGYRIWGVAADDSHRDDMRDQAWVMVNAEKNPASITESLKAGRFYASTGVQLQSLAVEGNELIVQTRNADVIRFITFNGVRLQSAGPSAVYTVKEEDVYVRVELFGSELRPAIYGKGMSKAWTNPVFVETPKCETTIKEFAVWCYQQPFT